MTQPETVTALLAELEGASAEDVLADAARRFPDSVAFASSLGLEDQVLTAMIAEAGSTSRSSRSTRGASTPRPTT